ncbi:MAG: alpha-amylase/4-alpha-glucanotransferase domain-containing protein [Planctomycetota bacterium]
MPINFIFCVHNHQPVGNFEDVMESAYKQAYEPFIDVIDRFPQIKFCVHYTGPLLQYLERAHPRFISRLQKMVSDNRVEIIGGGFYEPILPMLPENDKIGQIVSFSDYLEKLFGKRPRGVWLAERAWEQALTKPLAQAGVEFTILDDFHFRTAGFLSRELNGYFITEDQGHTLGIFPIPEKLRYVIPFREPQETINYLAQFNPNNHKDSNNVICYADDGEKFGLWPRTNEHCYQNKWLEIFLQTITAAQNWINITTFSEVLDRIKPAAKAYVPSGSYREMTEWALSNDAAMIYENYKHQQPQSEFSLNPGGFWRNFFVKYPEINLMYSRMMQVSRLLSSVPSNADKKIQSALAQARQELYRGQDNDAYWHGVFGGFYLPHLRHAIYNHLIGAEAILQEISPSKPNGKNKLASLEIADLDYDGYPEIRYSNKTLNCYFKPSQGGSLYEFDIVPKRFNPLATIRRRQESYHKKILEAQAQNGVTNVATIHDLVISKTKGLENLLYYDNYPRQSLMDHFIPRNTALNDFAQCHYTEEGDFLPGEYQVSIPIKKTAIRLSRDGFISQSGKTQPVKVTKNIAFASSQPATLQIDYEITNTGADPIEAVFGVEFNLSMLAGNAHDRFYYSGQRQNLGPLISQGEASDEKTFGIKDYYQKIDISFDLTTSAQIWYFPIQTVSQSEGGFELVYQSSVILPRWELHLKPSEKWQTRITEKVEFL